MSYKAKSDFNPTPEARLAMIIYGGEYSQQMRGAMGFWDNLSIARQDQVRKELGLIAEAAQKHQLSLNQMTAWKASGDRAMKFDEASLDTAFEKALKTAPSSGLFEPGEQSSEWISGALEAYCKEAGVVMVPVALRGGD